MPKLLRALEVCVHLQGTYFVSSTSSPHRPRLWLSRAPAVEETTWAFPENPYYIYSLDDAIASFVGRFPPSTEHTLPGWMTNCLSGRIANTFNFNGPNFIVDSACSSGVAAFVPAMYELAFGRSEMAMAGGMPSMRSAAGLSILSRNCRNCSRAYCRMVTSC